MKTKRSRSLTTAAAASLAAHTALLGGLIFWHLGAGHGPAESVRDREVKVSIRSKPLEKQIFLAKKASDRAAYRSGQASAERLKAKTEHLAAVSAQRLLNDPNIGIIFSVYFKTVRGRLSHAASAGKIFGGPAAHSAAVRFVLDRRGRILSFSVLEASSSLAADAAGKIMEAASPFPPFPSAIRHEAISFEVRFRFDAE